MIHLKKIIAFLLAAVLCIALAACGSSDDGDDERSTTDTTERAPKESSAGLDDETSDTEDTDGAAANVGEYVGLWSYVGENLWLRIYDDSTWEFLDENSAVLADGTLWAEEDGVTLHFGENGDVLMLDRTVSGDLIDSANGGTLVPAEEIVSNEPCFARAGIGLNAETDDGYYLLKDGVCTYYGLGEDYSTADCYWEVAKQREDVHDGIRELQFDAVCYIPESSIPQGDYMAYTKSELYDYYTGMWLTASTAYGNTQRGENYYVHTVSVNGQSYMIEFAYSTDWQYGIGEWAMILTKSYVVYMPEDYNGLIFAAEAQSDNYKDSAKQAQLDSIAPEACITDIGLIDPYTSLYFAVCD